MARRQFTRGPQRTPNRNWAGVVATAGTTLGANNKVLVATFTLANQGIDETILRTVGGISIASDQVAASESQFGALGVCVVSDQAIATGITAIPDPVTDVSDDLWMLYVSFAQEFRLGGTAASLTPNFATWYPFDSKAKRVVHSGYALAVVVANASASFGLKFAVNMRLLGQVRGT